MKVIFLERGSSDSKWLTLSWMILFMLVLLAPDAKAQDREFKKSSIRTGLGFGLNSGKEEIGFGLVYAIGWQKSIGEKDRVRINPSITLGGFMPFIVTDTRDQFYRITSLELNFHYDLIKYKDVSLVTSGGVFGNYSRGLLGTGGFPEENNNSSEYFLSFYYGGYVSWGLRIDQKNSKIASEIRPFNLHFGSGDFYMYYLMFCMEFKLRK